MTDTQDQTMVPPPAGEPYPPVILAEPSTESSSRDVGETAGFPELQQLSRAPGAVCGKFPAGFPHYLQVELQRRTPEQQVEYLTAVVQETYDLLTKERNQLVAARQAHLVVRNESTRRQRQVDDLAAKCRDLLEAQKEHESALRGRQRVIDHLRAERDRYDAALGEARAEVDTVREQAASWQEWGEGHKRRADAAPTAVAALKVTAGDRVAVLTPEAADEDAITEFQAELRVLFPGVEIIVLAGVTAVLQATGMVTTTASPEVVR